MHHYPEAAQDESFAPGESLALVAEADNRYDAEAIGVWNASRTLMIGHVPAMIVANLPRKRAALSLSEQLDAGKRTTLRILVSREPASLRVVPETEERAAWVRSTVVRLKDQAARGLPQETRVEADPLEQMAKTLEDVWGRPPRQPGS